MFPTKVNIHGEFPINVFRKSINYIIEAGGKVELLKLPKPKSNWISVGEIVKTAYGHEQYITKCIHDLVLLAEQEKDFKPWQLLQWFVTEQIEEEANSEELVFEKKIELLKAFTDPQEIYDVPCHVSHCHNCHNYRLITTLNENKKILLPRKY